MDHLNSLILLGYPFPPFSPGHFGEMNRGAEKSEVAFADGDKIAAGANLRVIDEYIF